MKLIKQNEVEFEPYYRTLPNLADNTEYSVSREYADTYKLGSILNKYTHFIENLQFIEQDLKSVKSFKSFNNVLVKSLKKIVNLKSAEFYFQVAGKQFLTPVSEEKVNEISMKLREIESNGLLDAIIRQGEIVLLAETESLSKDESRLKYLIVPVYEDSKRKGVLVIQTALSSFSKRSIESRFIKIIVERFVAKLNNLNNIIEMKDTYDELQAYQSKFRNEYNISAVGELTSEIVENILEPLQAIVSSTDILINENENEDSDILRIIKNKSKVIENSVKRIARFSSKNSHREKFTACNINEVINDFFMIIESSFEKKNYECLLDLDPNLPTILSHPDYLKQIITNIFIMLNASLKSSGGIWIQTRHEKDNAIVKIFCSDFVEDLAPHSRKNNNYLKIVSSLLKKHNGTIKYDSQKITGTSIAIKFPLRSM